MTHLSCLDWFAWGYSPLKKRVMNQDGRLVWNSSARTLPCYGKPSNSVQVETPVQRGFYNQ